jgi:hypothetical protein
MNHGASLLGWFFGDAKALGAAASEKTAKPRMVTAYVIVLRIPSGYPGHRSGKRTPAGAG